MASRTWGLASLIVILFLTVQHTYAQHLEVGSDSLDIYFRQDIHDIEPDVKNNRQSLEHLARIMDRITSDSLSFFDKIEIDSWTSPEPGEQYNEKLSWRRSNSIRDYILERWDLPDTMIVAIGRGVAWDKLRKLVAESNMQYRDEVLDIIDNQPKETWGRVDPNDRWLTLLDSRVKHLMDLRGGKPYEYLYNNLYPQLRYGSHISFYYNRPAMVAVEPEPIIEPEPVVEQPEPYYEPIVIEEEPEYERVPLFAVKTNLLFDALTILNVEIEVPIGDRWSIAGEWQFPWWTWDDGTADSKRHRTQLLNGNIEGKYWFGDRTDRPVMTGWYAGLYAGGGLYDFERNAKGYQGEFFIAAGIGGGYAHTINKSGNLRMEYSLGIGYMKTDYRYYEAEYGSDELWHPIRQYNGEYTWIGPTRARVSLVWLLTHKKKRGEIR